MLPTCFPHFPPRSPTVGNVSVDVKQRWTTRVRAQELCESRGGRPGLRVPNSPYVPATSKKHCLRAQELCESEDDVLGSPTLIALTVSGPKPTLKKHYLRAQELYESRGGRPGLPVPKSPDGLWGRKAALNITQSDSFVSTEVQRNTHTRGTLKALVTRSSQWMSSQ